MVGFVIAGMHAVQYFAKRTKGGKTTAAYRLIAMPPHLSALVRTDRAWIPDSEDGSLYRSADLGKSWQRLDHGVKAHATMMGVALHPRDPQQAAMIRQQAAANGLEIIDEGDHWHLEPASRQGGGNRVMPAPKASASSGDSRWPSDSAWGRTTRPRPPSTAASPASGPRSRPAPGRRAWCSPGRPAG